MATGATQQTRSSPPLLWVTAGLAELQDFAANWASTKGADDDRLGFARSFVGRVVEEWWCTLVGGDIRIRTAPAAQDLLSHERLAAERFGSAVAELPDEQAIYEIGRAYTSLLPGDFRAHHGSYYTPPDLANLLIERATSAGVDWSTARVLDPACGGGAFLAPVARRIVEVSNGYDPRAILERISDRLCGYEIDPFAAWLSQIGLDVALLPLARASRTMVPSLVVVRDSLRREANDPQFDLVIGNPPYGRVTLPASERALYKRSVYGHANLYGLFTDVAMHKCKPGGVIAFVTPTSFLSGQYFKNLRKTIIELAPPFSVDVVSSRKGVFNDVLQETLLSTFRRGGRKSNVETGKIIFTPSGLTRQSVGSAALQAESTQPWWLPREASEASLVGRLSQMRSRLADWGFSVSTGPLVWNRHKRQLSPERLPGSRPIIWAEAVDPHGSLEFRALRRGHALYFRPEVGDEWLLSRSPCVLLQRTTAKEQRHRLIAATLPQEFLDEHGAVVVENHLNMIRPVIEDHVSLNVLAAFLNSGAADRVFRCVSGSVAVSAYELESMPLPSRDRLRELENLVITRAPKEEIETTCSQLYELENEAALRAA